MSSDRKRLACPEILNFEGLFSHIGAYSVNGTKMIFLNFTTLQILPIN